MMANNTTIYEEVKEVVNFVTTMYSSLEVSLWRSCHELQLEVDRLVKGLE